VGQVVTFERPGPWNPGRDDGIGFPKDGEKTLIGVTARSSSWFASQLRNYFDSFVPVGTLTVAFVDRAGIEYLRITRRDTTVENLQMGSLESQTDYVVFLGIMTPNPDPLSIQHMGLAGAVLGDAEHLSVLVASRVKAALTGFAGTSGAGK
jgi:hypothetical protein